MPAEIQRVINAILSEFPQKHAFIDDILVVRKGREVEHIGTVENTLKKLGKENMSLKQNKCYFS